MKENIKILDEDIDPENFPVLYRWAKVNPQGLERTIMQISKKNNEEIRTSLVFLEHELSNDNS